MWRLLPLLALAAAGAPWPPRSISDLRAAVSTSQRGAAACVLFLNATATVGCAGTTGAAPLPLASAPPTHNTSSSSSRVVVVAGAGDDARTMDALRADPVAAARVGALVALPGPPPEGAWSADEANPQVRE